jgi:hypothetical protein
MVSTSVSAHLRTVRALRRRESVGRQGRSRQSWGQAHLSLAHRKHLTSHHSPGRPMDWASPPPLPRGRCSLGLGRAGIHARTLSVPSSSHHSTDDPVELVGSFFPLQKRERGSLGSAHTKMLTLLPSEPDHLGPSFSSFLLLESSFMHSLGQSKYKSRV